MSKKGFVLEEDGKYFKCMTGIGPSLTDNLSEAHVFYDRFDAAQAIRNHWAMPGNIVPIKDLT